MIQMELNEKSVLSAKALLASLALPAKKRQRLLWRVGALVRDSSKTNIRQQKTPEGDKWKARAKKRKGKKRRMLVGMIPLIVVSDRLSNDKRSVVTLKPWAGEMKSKNQTKRDAALVGNVHQKGRTVKYLSKRPPMRKSNKLSRKEAKLLRDMDFTVWARRINPTAKQGKRRRPPIKWIADNVTPKEFMRWAGKHREGGRFKSKYTAKLPSRRFLGVSRKRNQKIWERAFQGIDYGWNVKAQNMKRGR